jgi:hypothetical protein
MSSGSFRLAEMHWIIEPISVWVHSFSRFFSYSGNLVGHCRSLTKAIGPNPTQQQRAVAPGGLVYDHISLKLERTELANEREAILKNWIRMARYLYFLFENSPVRDVASKPTLKASLWMVGFLQSLEALLSGCLQPSSLLIL